MKNFLKACGFLLIIGVIYLIASGLAGIVSVIIVLFTQQDLFKPEVMQSEVQFMENILQLVGQFALPTVIAVNGLTLLGIFLMFLGRKESFKTYINFTPIKLKNAVPLFFFGIFLNILTVGLVSIVSELFPISEQMEYYSELLEPLMLGNPILVFFAIVISAPLFEEIALRGVVFNDFKKSVPVWLALVIQAAVFGLMHLNIIQGTYAFFLGLILGLVYHYYKSIWMPILVHLSFNLTSTLMNYVVSEEANLTLLFILIGGIGSIITVVIAKRIYRSPLDNL